VTLVLEGSNEMTDKKSRADNAAANRAKAEADAKAVSRREDEEGGGGSS